VGSPGGSIGWVGYAISTSRSQPQSRPRIPDTWRLVSANERGIKDRYSLQLSRNKPLIEGDLHAIVGMVDSHLVLGSKNKDMSARFNRISNPLAHEINREQ
jgi:hypothetical protein